MAQFPSPTTGLGVAAKIVAPGNQSGGTTVPGYNNVTLSLTGAGGFPTSFQLNPTIEDAGGNPITPGTAFTLTSVANSSGQTAVYTGTITGGGTNAFAGFTFVVAGFVATPANNGDFICTASSTTTLTLENASAVSETHAATATSQEVGANVLTYVADGSASYTQGTYNPGANPTRANVVSVSSKGNITNNAVEGGSVVEVSYPTFNNTVGTAANGTPTNKVYAEVNVSVIA